MNKLHFNIICVFLVIAFNSFGTELTNVKSADDDRQKIEMVKAECTNLKNYIVKNKFEVACNDQFLFYGTSSDSYSSSSKSLIKIANYNLLHPGTSKSLFKDYELVAKIANTFDFISAQEILSMIGHDADVNSSIDAYIESSSSAVEKEKAKKLYRMPGYLKLLMELKKLDSSWSLILSPRGDSALAGSVEEHVGFYYRSSIISPKLNQYCYDNLNFSSNRNSFACLVDYGAKNKFVSRRPFIASFKAQSMSFTVMASHIVFNFSGDEDQSKDLIKNIFKKESLDQIGMGVNSVNFARFAEIKLAVDFLKKYIDNYGDSKIFISSDMNLNPEIDYWSEVLNVIPGFELLIKEPTTISPQRFNRNNEETFGVASSYDHFIINRKVFSNCDQGSVYNYYTSPIEKDIEEKYYIRPVEPDFSRKISNAKLDNENPVNKDTEDGPIDDGSIKLDYNLSKAGEAKMNEFTSNYEKFLKTLKTVKNNQIVQDDFQFQERIDGAKNRLFLKQLTNPFYYRFYQEILSDHFPAYISCKI